jgi:hypothetical protein
MTTINPSNIRGGKYLILEEFSVIPAVDYAFFTLISFVLASNGSVPQ